jgi:NADH:ubiquinone oxidoreductase subunit 6 (subunit J)
MALSFNDLLRQNEFWAFLFILGGILLNWPMLSLAVESTILGVPAILVYLTAIWLLIILILFLFDRGYPG